MPGPNDFLETMRRPAWLTQGSQGSGNWSSGPIGDPNMSWSKTFGRYGGNAGGMVGGAMDSMYPMDTTFGIFAGLSSFQGNARKFSDQRTNQISVAKVMESSNQEMQERIQRRLTSMGISPARPEDRQAVVGQMAQNEGIRNMVGGSLSTSGAGAYVAALANKDNRFKPSTAEVMSLQRAASNYYGFDTGEINYSRTLGRSQDELAHITAETRRRRDPSTVARERIAAVDELATFNRDTVGGALTKELGVDTKIWQDELAKGGTTSSIVARVAEREAARLKKGTAAELSAKMIDVAGGVAEKAYGLSKPDVDSVLNKRLMGADGASNKMLASFEAAGFSGTYAQLNKTLETAFGDESMDPNKMRALSERMRAIAEGTGEMFESIANMTRFCSARLAASLLGSTRLRAWCSSLPCLGPVTGSPQLRRTWRRPPPGPPSATRPRVPAGLVSMLCGCSPQTLTSSTRS